MPKNDKPNAVHLGWNILATTHQPFNARFHIRQDQIRLPNGAPCTYTYPVKTPAIFIVPLTSEGDLILIRQYRYIIDKWLWEIPAGGTHDFHGDDLRDLVKRELWEEVGGKTDTIIPLSPTYGLPGFTTIKVFGFLALNVTLDATNHPEAGEHIEVHPTPIPQALDLMRQGETTSAIDAYYVFQQEPLLRAIHARITKGEPFDDLMTHVGSLESKVLC